MTGPGTQESSTAEVDDVQAEEGKTSEGAQLTGATVSRCHSRGGVVRKRSMSWVQWHKRKRDGQLVRAAVEVLNAVKHDTSQLMVVSAVIDGRRCKDVLIDPGASSNFVRQEWVQEVGLPVKTLTTPLDVTLADGKVGARLTHAVQVNALVSQGSSAPCRADRDGAAVASGHPRPAVAEASRGHHRLRAHAVERLPHASCGK